VSHTKQTRIEIRQSARHELQGADTCTSNVMDTNEHASPNARVVRAKDVAIGLF